MPNHPVDKEAFKFANESLLGGAINILPGPSALIFSLSILHTKSLLKGWSPISQFLDGTIPGNNTPTMGNNHDSLDRIVTTVHDTAPALKVLDSPLDIMTLLFCVARVICFIPWCIIVGGALLLFPQYLEYVTFRTGYLPSVQGIRRFAHWANCALQHLLIFIAFVLAIGYCNKPFGIALGAFALARSLFVWQDFKFDRSIPLGQDDRQSLYMIAMMEDYGIQEGVVIIKPSEDDEIRQLVTVDEDAWLRRLTSAESA